MGAVITEPDGWTMETSGPVGRKWRAVVKDPAGKVIADMGGCSEEDAVKRALVCAWLTWPFFHSAER